MSPSSRDPFNSRETTKGNEGSMVFELLNRPEGRVAVTFEDRFRLPGQMTIAL